MRYVFDFDHHHEVSPKELNALLGGKGANLAEMTAVLRLPVPHGFTISTEACRAYLDRGWPDGLDAEVEGHVRRLEEQMERRLGDPADPLLVSVRSGAEISMPGMMDTVLNLGLNDESVVGLARTTAGDRFAYDCYRRFIQMYASIVLDLDAKPFDAALEEAKATLGVESDSDVPADALVTLVGRYLELVEAGTRRPFPSRPPINCAARSRRCFALGTRRGRSPTGAASESPTTWAPPSRSRRWSLETATTALGPASDSRATRQPVRTVLTAISLSMPRVKTSSPESATRFR